MEKQEVTRDKKKVKIGRHKEKKIARSEMKKRKENQEFMKLRLKERKNGKR